MNPLIPVPMHGNGDLIPTHGTPECPETTLAPNLIVGMPYVGTSSMCPELDGMLFYPVSIGTVEHDMMDGSEFVPMTVEVGTETWDVLTPADSDAILVNVPGETTGDLAGDPNRTEFLDLFTN